MKKRFRIRGKIMYTLFIFSIIISIAIGLITWYGYNLVVMRFCNIYAFSHAHSLSSMIDGDRIAHYLETGEEDEYYKQMKERIDVLRKEQRLEYLYVFVPRKDNLVYIWDAENEEDTAYLGEVENYGSSDDKESAFAAMADNPSDDLQIETYGRYGMTASAYVPVYDSKDNPVAVVGVDISLPYVFLRIIPFILIMIAVILIITDVALVILYYNLNKNLVRPIRTLNHAVTDIVDQLDRDEAFEVDVHTGDELEELSASFGKMYEDLRSYIKSLSAINEEKQRISAELSLARRIQAAVLPDIFPPFPEHSEFDIYARMTPAREVGGDFYDFFFIDENRLTLVIADVSGKGIPAALFMMIIKIMIKNYAQSGKSPCQVLEELNRQVCQSNTGEMFVTVWLGILDIRSGLITAANAGHEYPVIKRAGEKFAVYREKHSFVVGGLDWVVYKDYQFKMNPGDTLFLYTDGVTEATDREEKMFGLDSLVEALNESQGQSPRELTDAVEEAIRVFVDGEEAFDDTTMLCLNYSGMSGSEDSRSEAELQVEADSQNERRVTDFVRERLLAAGCGKRELNQICIALDEVFSNIVNYGYPEEAGQIRVRVEIRDDRMAVITLEDRGIPFNPLKEEEPDIHLLLEDRPVGGLGIFIVRQTMDEVDYDYKNGKNVLCLKKKI